TALCSCDVSRWAQKRLASEVLLADRDGEAAVDPVVRVVLEERARHHFRFGDGFDDHLSSSCPQVGLVTVVQYEGRADRRAERIPSDRRRHRERSKRRRIKCELRGSDEQRLEVKKAQTTPEGQDRRCRASGATKQLSCEAIPTRAPSAKTTQRR